MSTSPPSVNPTPAAMGLEGLDLEVLATFLKQGGVPVAGALTGQLVSGGKSNLTFIVSDGSSEWVVRRPPLGTILQGAHDVAREYRVMAALENTGVPVPVVRGLNPDTSLMGAPFYVMDRVRGTVYRTPEDVAALSVEQRRCIGEELVDVLADLHDVDFRAAGLGDLGRPDGYLERQVVRWRRQYDRIKVRELTEVEVLAEGLLRRLPTSSQPALVHGDYRLDNVIVVGPDSGSIAAVLDWELATLGDPLADLGTLLMFWDEPGRPFNPITRGLMAVEGFPTRDQVLARYLARRPSVAGDDLEWYLVFAEFKLAVILEQIHARHLEGKTRGEGFEEVGKMVTDLLSSAQRRAASSGYLRS